tara:strand:- start:143 stop:349 length:207 start_codon:yes stop_codon:yes gene_type:complete
MGSKKFSLNWSDFSGVLRNASLVGGAAALAYVAQNLTSLDLGSMGVLFIPIVAVALDTAIKWMKDNSK